MRNKSFFGHKTKIGYRDDFKNDLKKNNYYYGHVILNIELAKGKKTNNKKKIGKRYRFFLRMRRTRLNLVFSFS